ncbi:MAG: glycoside hydrolase domain-containing protein, partial [Acidimicrobiales bacterium]
AGGRSQGTADATAALSNLRSIGAPSGLIVYCDIEAYDTITGAVEYADGWGTKINGSGSYKAGFYGPDTVLSRTNVTWHSLWENPTCFGSSLPGANITQGAEACSGGTNHTCGGHKLLIDTDKTLTKVGGAWGL